MTAPTPMRLVDTGLAPAARNIAISAALMELHRAGQTPDTLHLCRFPRAVLVGPSEAIGEAVNLNACRQRRVEVARRTTGGDAIYVSPGVLVWEVVAVRGRFGTFLDEIAENLCTGIAASLGRLGLPAHFRPPADVVVGGRRIGSASGVASGDTIVFQGTVQVELDAQEMAIVLIPHDESGQPRRDGVSPARLAASVTSLSEWLGRMPPWRELKPIFLTGLVHHWGCAFADVPLSADERARVEYRLGQDADRDAFAELRELGGGRGGSAPPAGRRP